MAAAETIMTGTITGATSDTYTPKAGDVGGALTATASYFDGESDPKAIIMDIIDNEAEEDSSIG